MSRYRVCILCMAEGQELAYLVIRWRRPVDGRIFTAGPRCVDRAGCRARVETSGDTWEVAEAGDPIQPEPSRAPNALRRTPEPAAHEPGATLPDAAAVPKPEDIFA
jgi:hypothetical protein